MRAFALLFVALLFGMAVPPAAAADQEVRAVSFVNRFVDYDGCQMAPGESCDFMIRLLNPYNATMEATNLSVEIYQYATVEGTRPVDASWTDPYPALNATGARRVDIELGDLPSNTSWNVTFRILTSWTMPHGSALSQGSYFLRFWMEFDHTNTTNVTSSYRFASWSHFSRAQLLDATAEARPGEAGGCPRPWCYGDVNLSRLGGIDGLLPDSAFGVHEPFPAWPYYVLLGGTGFFLVLAVFLYAEENPKALPRVARSWAILRGWWRQAPLPRRRT